MAQVSKFCYFNQFLELCVDYFNLAGFDTTLTGQSDLDVTKARLDRLDVARAAAVSRETCASPTSLVLALVYLERLRGSNPTYLHTVSSADLFLVSLVSKLLNSFVQMALKTSNIRTCSITL